MALDSTRLSDNLKTAIETAFGLGTNPDYDSAELKKFTDAIAQNVIQEFVNNAELLGTITDPAVSGSVTTDTATYPLDNGTVDDNSVGGGIQ